MGKSLFLITIFFGLSAGVFANPLNPYNSPLISEVQITDSVHWVIELDGRCCQQYTRSFPCSLSVLRFRIASSGKIYNFKAFFDTANISVLTRASITGIPKTENVVIRSIDTLMILDTMWTINGTWKSAEWSFSIHPAKPGNSLVNIGSGKSFETVRTSIGRRGNYTTEYDLLLLDSQLKPVPFLRYYVYSCSEMPVMCDYQYVFTSDSTGKLKIIANLLNKPITIYFSDTNTDASIISSQHFFKASWYGAYIDTALQIKDTVIFSYTSIIPENEANRNYSHLLFEAIPKSKTQITFIISAHTGASNALIQVFTLNGRQIANLKIPLTGAGTYSYVWNYKNEFHKDLSNGPYICNLSIDKSVPISRAISIK